MTTRQPRRTFPDADEHDSILISSEVLFSLFINTEALLATDLFSLSGTE